MTHETLSTLPTTQTLTVRELHEALQQRGIEISYKTVSDLLNAGDIADQLQIHGSRNSRQILPDVADILAAFIPEYRRAQGRLPQAPDLLRAFLKQKDTSGQELTLVHEFPTTDELPATDTLTLAREQGRAQGIAMTERILTAQEAAEVLRCSVPLLRQSIPPFRKLGRSRATERWLLSDLLARP